MARKVRKNISKYKKIELSVTEVVRYFGQTGFKVLLINNNSTG